ncbi:MAG: hypothetical protein GXY03_00205 [Solirubrobacterales bacterium]|nr:hypothetical protein [Solirubrobacterales bacterium]
MTDQIYTLKRGPEGPKRVRVVGWFGRKVVLEDAADFGSPFTLTTAQASELYGIAASPPPAELDVVAERVAANAERQARPQPAPKPMNLSPIRTEMARRGRPTATPEEAFAAEADEGS